MNKTETTHNTNLVKEQDNPDNKTQKMLNLLSMADIDSDSKVGNSFVVKTTGKSLKTDFINSKRNCMGNITVRDFKSSKGEIGVYDSKMLSSMLKVVPSNIDLDFGLDTIECGGNKVVKNINMTSGSIEVNYNCADISIMDNIPTLKKEVKYGCSFKLTEDSVKQIIKCTSPFNEKNVGNEIVTFSYNDGDTLTASFGNSFYNIQVPVEYTGKFPEGGECMFRADILSELLVANQKCKEVKVRMEKEGGALQLDFNYGDYHGSYFMVGIKDFSEDFREKLEEDDNDGETDKTETVEETVEVRDEYGVHEGITTPLSKPEREEVLKDKLIKNPSSRIPHSIEPSVETEEVLA